ncbi:hypothetical protein PoB_000601200 [Plakobranchus ocellatus]|uniref:Uncharacterized protein n=1 Tax=Plakobranchus ocellatus TaxID=259542 RepID=A0AAV3YBM8_9GAST|nr:hypothetical protein PoB_000601200 [Plakobranchus ocellatus]
MFEPRNQCPGLAEGLKARDHPVVNQLYARKNQLADNVDGPSDLKLSGPPSGQGAGGMARTTDRMYSADLRADSLPTVSPTPSLKE